VVGEGLTVPLRELRFEFARASGPGGQNVNKRSTRATLRFAASSSPSLPADVRARLLARVGRRLVAGGVLVISSQRFRDQGRNVADCLEKLRALLREAALPPRPRRPTRPTRAAGERRIRAKRLRSEAKQRRRPDEDG
jgi:ribosome-associated protein